MELAVENATLYYQLDGAKDGKLIMFANSLGSHLEIWNPMLPYLPLPYQFLRYDKRGHGKSVSGGAFGMNDLVDDVIKLIEHIGAKDIIFVGLSIGGLIGIKLAATRPDLVRGLVIIDSAVKIGKPEVWQQRVDMIKTQGLATIATSVIERWFTAEFINAGKAQKWQEMLENISADGYIHCGLAIAETNFTVQAEQLTMPCLLLAGSADVATPPEMVRSTAKLIGNATFKIIDNAGHIPCVEQPEITANYINEFLKEAML